MCRRPIPRLYPGAGPEDLKLLVESLMPLVDRGMKVSESELRDKFGLADPKEDEAMLQPLTVMGCRLAAAAGPNRQQGQRLAINRIQQPSEQAIDQLTEAMSDWVEVGGEDFMDPILELAKKPPHLRSSMKSCLSCIQSNPSGLSTRSSLTTWPR